MDISPRSCRLCLSTTEFIISLYSNYCQKNNVIDKILACYNLLIKESDYLTAICYKCAGDVEKYYDSITLVKESQMRLDSVEKSKQRFKTEENKRHVTSYVREQVIDADYTFSFLDVSFSEEPKKSKQSSAFFSYFSSPNVNNSNDCKWRTPRSINARNSKRDNRQDEFKGNLEKSRRQSRDLFESQSQDNIEDNDFRMDWKLSPDEDIIRRVREKCFGRSDF